MPPQLGICHKRGQTQAIKDKKLVTQYIFHYMYIHVYSKNPITENDLEKIDPEKKCFASCTATRQGNIPSVNGLS